MSTNITTPLELETDTGDCEDSRVETLYPTNSDTPLTQNGTFTVTREDKRYRENIPKGSTSATGYMVNTYPQGQSSAIGAQFASTLESWRTQTDTLPLYEQLFELHKEVGNKLFVEYKIFSDGYNPLSEVCDSAQVRTLSNSGHHEEPYQGEGVHRGRKEITDVKLEQFRNMSPANSLGLRDSGNRQYLPQTNVHQNPYGDAYQAGQLARGANINDPTLIYKLGHQSAEAYSTYTLTAQNAFVRQGGPEGLTIPSTNSLLVLTAHKSLQTM